jgi:hypothetical protein
MIRWRRVGILAFVVTSLTATMLLAEPAHNPTDRVWLRQPTQRAPTSPASVQLSYGRWAAVALLVGLAGFALYKRKLLRRAGTIAVASQVQIGSVTKISHKAQLIVATVNGRSMLLGVTDANVTRLMWLDEADDADDDWVPDVRHPGYGQGSRNEGSGARSPVQMSPNHLAARRADDPRPSSPKTPPAPSAPTKRQPSRFREVLADAIGLTPKAVPRRSASKAPVDELVPAAEDRYLGRDTRPMNTARLGQRSATPSPLIDIEGQAAGLVALLNRPES